MVQENENLDPQDDSRPDPLHIRPLADPEIDMVHVNQALGRVFDDLVIRAGQTEKDEPLEGQVAERSHEHGGALNPALFRIESEVAALRHEYDKNPTPELDRRMTELREQYDQIVMHVAESIEPQQIDTYNLRHDPDENQDG